ncbi:MAG TPA: hypothetical protein VGP92_14945 [Acidimicrobiia bacterium]|nr:hypothetical protein [Acidimicrobiia bacterium]
MDRRWHRTDGFQTTSGVLAVLAGPVLLAHGAPAGWSFILIAAGLVLLVTQWVIVNEIRFEMTDRTALLLGIGAIACVSVAVVYLTRAADDLPVMFPGRDGDSEHFRILPGILTLALGAVLLVRSVSATRPHRLRVPGQQA